MNRLNEQSRVRPGRTMLGWLTAILALVQLPAAVWAQTPDLTVGADRFPDADGIILRWEQSWTLDKDGTVHRRDHQWFKYLSTRPIRSTADQRLDFHATQDELKIHVARTHLEDGTILPVPDYSFNLAGPDDVAGWPAYADWRQMVVSFSGIEPNAVIELDYEVITQPRIMTWIDADLRLEQEYPTLERVVTVTAPDNVPVYFRVDGLEEDHLTRTDAGDATAYRWVFKDLPGGPDEPQALPWRERCGRLRFTTAKDGAFWAKAFVWGAEMAALPDEQIKRLAESAVKEEGDPTERVRLVAEKLQRFVQLHHVVEGASASVLPRRGGGAQLELRQRVRGCFLADGGVAGAGDAGGSGSGGGRHDLGCGGADGLWSSWSGGGGAVAGRDHLCSPAARFVAQPG